MLKIEIEGLDGSGKTTGMTYLADLAMAQNIHVTTTREVGNPNVPICMDLRSIVLHSDPPLNAQASELIFSAMRVINQEWIDNLKAKNLEPELLISDRGWLSHLAFSRVSAGAEFTNALYRDNLAMITDLPDIVIYFDVNPKTAAKRMAARGTTDAIEARGVEFQKQVGEEFEILLKTWKDDFTVYRVNANKGITNVEKQLEQILKKIATKLKESK